jgi:ubiquinone/menaquinone biosynthesis C-methylase UbiE
METLVKSKTSSSCCDDTCCVPAAEMTDLKQTVKERYAAVAEGKTKTCCDGTCCGGNEVNSIADSYENLDGYQSSADLQLGCGLPTQFARINKGDTVVDLGSGAGNDVFIARHETGETGKVIGLDFTEAMIIRARKNALQLRYNNVEFIQGDIENIPLPDAIADVVVSNCVMNLVPDKRKAFEETFRILKPGGHFSISDVITIGQLPQGLQQDAEQYAGCISGAMEKQPYLHLISSAGFTGIVLQKERKIELPGDVLDRFYSAAEKEKYLNGASGIFSITVYAEKPHNA